MTLRLLTDTSDLVQAFKDGWCEGCPAAPRRSLDRVVWAIPFYTGTPCETPMPFSIRPHRFFPPYCTRGVLDQRKVISSFFFVPPSPSARVSRYANMAQ